MASPIKELFYLVAGKNSLPPRESFKASSIRTAKAARFQKQGKSLPNNGVGHSGATRNWCKNICPSQQQRSARVTLSVIAFPIALQMAQIWEEKALD